jgi:hypothetical protein
MLYVFHSWTFYCDMYFEIYSTSSQLITSSEQLAVLLWNWTKPSPIEMQTSSFVTAVVAGNSCRGWIGSVSIVDIWNLPRNGGNTISEILGFKLYFPGKHALELLVVKNRQVQSTDLTFTTQLYTRARFNSK